MSNSDFEALILGQPMQAEKRFTTEINQSITISHSHINLVHRWNHEWLRRIWSCSKITWHTTRL